MDILKKEMKEYRMKRAAILLRQTQATIAEISKKVFNPKQTRKIAAVIILVVIVAMVATSIIPYII